MTNSNPPQEKEGKLMKNTAQNDPGPEDIPLTARLGSHDALEFALLFRNEYNPRQCLRGGI